MEMDYMMDLSFSGCSSTSSTTSGGDGSAWVDWSPAIDWGHLSGNDEFNGLMEHYGLPCSPDLNGWSSSVSPASTGCPGSPAAAAESSNADDRGLRLVHLLVAAAEALAGPIKGGELARVILVRLRELLSAGGATSMERLAEHFTDALQRLIDGGGRHDELPLANPGEVLEAFQMLQDMSPYVKFGHFTANQAILEAVASERRVHIVDYDIMEGVQWASLMQALSSRQDPPHLRITAVARCGGGGRRTGAAVLETGRRLVAFASSVGLSFSFGQCKLDPDDRFRPAAVKAVKGEAVVLNCALHPPHLLWRSAASVESFLGSAGALGARAVTVVEEAVAGGGGGGNGFVGLFMEEMKRYSAMWDSLEAGFPMQGKARGAVERLILGPMIAGAVGRAYHRREKGGEEGEGWAEWVESAGFGKLGLSFFNICQSRLLLGLFNDGYRVEEQGSNKLVFCWKNCRLLSASVWSAPSVGSPLGRSFSC